MEFWIKSKDTVQQGPWMCKCYTQTIMNKSHTWCWTKEATKEYDDSIYIK